MPQQPGIAQAFRLALGVAHVRDLQNFWIARQLELVQHMDLQRPPQTAEGHLLRRGDALVTEHQHMVLPVRLLQTLKILLQNGLRQIQPQHFCPQIAYRTRITWQGTNFKILGSGVQHILQSGSSIKTVSSKYGRHGKLLESSA